MWGEAWGKTPVLYAIKEDGKKSKGKEYTKVHIEDGRDRRPGGAWNYYVITKDMGKDGRVYLAAIEKMKGPQGIACYTWAPDKKKAMPFGNRKEATEYARLARGEVKQKRKPKPAGEGGREKT